MPEAKEFKPKHCIPKLEDYRIPPKDEFWELFPSNKEQAAVSLVNGDVLKKLALESGFEDLELLETVCEDLRWGADIGCRGTYRQPSRATNAPSAYEDGEKVTDAIADWIIKGFAYGPVDQSEVPGNAKFSGIMTKAKPNGSVRIILNLSSPAGQAVNDGIDSKEFPTEMSSTTLWLRALNKAGKECLICKIDWADAYKHIAVREEDTDLQWFTWLGKCFKELCLIFGGRSSAGIFDRVAKIVLYIVIKRSGIDKDFIIQHLDDCCGAAPKGTDWLYKFDHCFAEVAAELGVKLAPRDDPDKSFGPQTFGTVLGLQYDTVAWTWGLSQEKLLRILHQIDSVISQKEVRQDLIWSLVGRILNIKPLVPLGRFNVDKLLKANNVSDIASDLVQVTDGLRHQLRFWSSLLPLCSHRVLIPNPDEKFPLDAIEIFTDAAGGSWREPGKGVGAVGKDWWSYVPWSKRINRGARLPNGKRLDRLLSALELVGPLLVLSAGHKVCYRRAVKVWVDNIGAVFIWEKGYSNSCDLSTTLVKACATIAAGLGCKFTIAKITRCSNRESRMADALSKADFCRFRRIALEGGYNLPMEMETVPSTLLRWVSSPWADDQLGDRILRQISEHFPVLGYSEI